MFLQSYTLLHTLISLVGIFTGLVVLLGLLRRRRFDGWTKWFLVTTTLTSVTGFFFPFHGFTPAIGLGVISLVVLLATHASMGGMNKFDLRPVPGGKELSGGPLETPLQFSKPDAERRAIYLAGFLSQEDGGILRFLDEAGSVVATKECRDNPFVTSALRGSR